MLVVFAAVGIPSAMAATSPYLEKFDGLDVSSHDFAPTGWGHIVDSYTDYDYGDTYYVEYANPDSGGQDGSFLSVDSQEVGYGWSTGVVDDILVTPAVSGEVGLYVKLTKASGSIKFYTCTESGGKFVKGDEYPVELPTLSTDAWTKVTLPSVPAGTRLGIRGEYVGIDEFSAESAEIVLKKELTIKSVAYTGSDPAEADESGSVTLTFDVVLTNSGEVDFAPNDEGYSLSIVTSDGTLVSGPVSITEALAAGATSSTIKVSSAIAVPTSLPRARYDIKENISGTQKYGGWIELVAYSPSFEMAVDNEKNMLSSGATVDFGIVQAAVSRTFYIVNDGAAPLNVTEWAVDGAAFRVKSATIATESTTEAVTFPYSLPKHSSICVEVEFDNPTASIESGTLTVKAEGFDDFTVNMTGRTLDPNAFYEPFDSGTVPTGCYFAESEDGSVDWAVEKFSANDDNYCAVNDNASDPSMFVLPLMTFTEAANTVSFKAAKRGSSAFLKVYYSQDRKTWTLSREITVDEMSSETYSSGSFDNFKLTDFTAEIPAGDYYVAFEAGYARVDDIVGGIVSGERDKAVVVATDYPSTGMVNYPFSVEARLFNTSGAAFAEGEVTVELKLTDASGSQVMASRTLPELAHGDRTKVELSFTPREAKAYDSMTLSYKIGETSAVEEQLGPVTIEAERMDPTHQVGESNSTTSVPVSMNWKHTDSEMIYPKDLIGLAAGTEVKGIAFKGNKTSSNDHTIHLTVWVENTADTAPTTDDLYPTAAMTQIFDGDYPLGTAQGEFSIDIDMSAAPFAYSGENLRIVAKARTVSTQYSAGNFIADKNYESAVYRRKDNEEPSGTLSSCALPVLYLNVDKEVKTISGTVTDQKTAAPLQGISVALASGEVSYSAETDANGKYTLDVMQDKLVYDMTLSIADDSYMEVLVPSISFADGSVVKDVAMVSGEGFLLHEFVAPAEGEVNSEAVFTATLANGMKKEAGSYTAKLYVNGNVVSEAEAVAIEAREKETFEFSYTPHATGSIEAYVEFVCAAATVKSEPATVTIKEESADAEKRIGTPSKFDYAGPYNFYNKQSQTEIIYPASLIGLKEGDKILSVKFKGYSSRESDFEVKAWMGNVAAGTAFQGEATDGLEQVSDAILSITDNLGSETSPVTLVEIQFADGFVYTGGDVRFVFSSVGDNWTKTYFEVDGNVSGQAQQRAHDSGDLSTKSWSAIGLPVAYFETIPYRTVSGTVTDGSGNPVAGADVTLKSGNIEYYAVSAEDGTYAANVIKFNNSYEMTVSAEGYQAYTHASAIAFGAGNVVADVVLAEEIVTATFSGTVLDDVDNTPVAGAKVTLSSKDDGKSVWKVTDEAGKFSFADIDAKAYDVEVTCTNYIATVSATDLTEGDVTGFEIRLVPVTYTVKGKVTDVKTKEAVAGATVELLKDGESYVSAVTGADGTYEFESVRMASASAWQISFAAEEYEGQTNSVDLQTAVDGTIVIDVELSGTSSVGELTADGMKVYGGAGCIYILTDRDNDVRIYNAAGVQVRGIRATTGKNRVDGIGSGIYVVNGAKLIVR